MKTKTMKRFALLILPFLLIFGTAHAQKGPEWLDGSWSGVGYQENTNTIWGIVLSCDPVGNQYKIEYPDIPCGGRWKLLSFDDSKAIFWEEITEKEQNCVQGSKMVLTLISSEYITYSCFDPITGELAAHSTLRRVPQP